MRHSAIIFFAIVSIFPAWALRAGDASTKLDPRYPFRTDFANANLPWYMPKNGEFPPHHSDRRISGELVAADFYHRRGQFRTRTGELVDFTMPPYGVAGFLNTDADLRDLPLGTYFLFFLNQDEHGKFTRMATCRDQFSIDAGHGFSYRLDAIDLEHGKLTATRQAIAKKQLDAGKSELFVTPHTRVWKADKLARLSDLAVGDILLYNLSGKTQDNPGHCTDIWVGADLHQRVTENQQKNFAAFTKTRGVPGWIDRVEGNTLAVTLFSGDFGAFKKTLAVDFAVGKEIRCCVANDELRTWNPPVDGERAPIQEVQKASIDCYGSSGVRIVFTVKYMLEGFRKGRVVRIFGPGWTCKDPPCGEGLMNYGYGHLVTSELWELPPKEYPAQFPFRTDYGNENLGWYQLKAGEIPPRFSEHLVFGEVVKTDAASRTGQFRTDRTGELVDFALIQEEPAKSDKSKKTSAQQNVVMYHDADAGLSDLPPGTRCRFSMYQDDKGAFTRAAQIWDEFSYLAQNGLTYRVESLDLEEGKLFVARQIPEVKNYDGDMIQPPDIGRLELRVTPDTHVWKAGHEAGLHDLAVGDELLVNVTSEQKDSPSHCTEIWAGTESHKLATEEQHSKRAARK